jgi:membrane protein implicated in regulation of membrane protease activity
MYIGLGIALLVIGAILYFAIGTTVVAGINLSVVGIILMVAGVVAIILSFAMRGRTRAGYSTVRESQVDPATGTRVDRTDVDPH